MARTHLRGAQDLQAFVRESTVGQALPAAAPRRIVVAYAAEEAAPLLDWASQLGRSFQSSVWLTHVSQSLATQAFEPQLPPIPQADVDRDRTNAQRLLESAADGMNRMGMRAEVRMEEGWGPERVADVARRVDADLIIAGAPKRRALARVGLGSFADALLKRLPCDLLQVRGPAHARKIVVAIDRTPQSRAAVRAALAVGQVLGAKVALVHAMDVDEVQEAQGSDPRLISWEGMPERIEGVSVSYHLVVGAPAEATAAFARSHGADLVFVGTRHERGWRRFAHGSVAAQLGHATDASLWIVAPE